MCCESFGLRSRVRRQPQLFRTVHNLALLMKAKARKSAVLARQKNSPVLIGAATQQCQNRPLSRPFTNA